jgi:ankyrin repeat protein
VAVCAAFLSGPEPRATAADIRVTTEYRYPTRYEVQPGQIVVNTGGGTIVQETVVVPSDFETREVGVIFSVEALVSSLNHGAVTLTSLEQAGRNGNTELMLAATRGDLAAVRTLLHRGAVVNAKNYFGSTALLGAAAGGFDAVVRLLLLRGAHVDARSHTGSTPLMFAAKNGHTAVVKTLLRAGANVNGSDVKGLTALMYAAYGGYAPIVELLLARGAKPDAVGLDGATPRRLALIGEHDQVVALLARAGASR